MLKRLSLALLLTTPLAVPLSAAPPKQVESFKPFTGRITANKVRIRAKADLDAPVVRQVGKDDLLLVLGEEGDFYAVQPPTGVKAYVFRSYVLDNVIEANRVNVRLEPNVDAPIIGQLQAGDRVLGEVCPLNHKWMSINPPPSSRFYVSKEYIAQAGGPDYLSTMDRRKNEVETLLSSAFLSAEGECQKNYEEMNPELASEQFHSVIKNFHDFPKAVEQAKEGLALLKETYLQKKIGYLEAKAELSTVAKEELIAKHRAEAQSLFSGQPDPALFERRKISHELASGSLPHWDNIEESLYLSWSAFHAGKKMEDYYTDQQANATPLTGRLERYDHTLKDKPGDYLLRGPDAPLAYLYSTKVDLSKYEGKEVTILAAPRPNHHFAFPAYFALSIE